MKQMQIVLICFACSVGCNRSDEIGRRIPPDQLPTVESVPQEEIQHTLAQISIGTLDTDLIATLKPKSLDYGTVYGGGTGARRIYFQIAQDKQTWFELSGPPYDNVTMIGPIEAKTKWSRFEGDSIIVH